MHTVSNFIFFGSSELSVIVLKEMENHGIKPIAIVTTLDKPKGRKLVLTPPDIKVYGEEKGIPVLQFAKLNEEAITQLKDFAASYYLVASYGLIIPQAVLDIPTLGVLNIHPSLLPKYRGASPIQNAILDDVSNTGITIMKMDAKMDHGPIMFQEERSQPSEWPKKYTDLETELALQATSSLINLLPEFLEGKVTLREQNHDEATFTKKFTKADGLINIQELSGEIGRKQFLKFCAFEVWPTTYFIIKKQDTEIRVKITDAMWNEETQSMTILKVIPEGQKEVAYSDFLERVKMYY